jgi:glutaredoxin
MDRLILVVAIVASVAVLGVLWRRQREQRDAAIADRVDLIALGLPTDAGAAVVLFKGPLCHDCQLWAAALDERSVPYRAVDVVGERELATGHGVAATPVVLVADTATGAVLQRYTEAPDEASVRRVRSAVVT